MQVRLCCGYSAVPLALFSGIANRNKHIASAEMLARIVGFDWKATDLGPMERWPSTLVGVVRLLVSTSAPQFILAGRKGVLLYNDAAGEIGAETFAAALGRSVFDVLPHASRFYRQVLAAARRGASPRYENQPLKLRRQGRFETGWFNLVFTPIIDYDGNHLGVLVHAYETTQQIADAAALAASEARFRALVETIPQMTWSSDGEGNTDYLSARWYEFTGIAPGTVEPAVWRDLVHPADRARVFAEWYRAIDSGERFDIEYRFRHHSGEYRWLRVMARPLCDRDGRVTRWFGTSTDIHESKNAAAQLELFSRELNHRIKNIFALVDGLVRLSARHADSPDALAENLAGRIRALALAHDLARPDPDSRDRGKVRSMHAIAAQLLAPYEGGSGARFVCEGPDAGCDESVAAAIALLFHELATNAAKYGALSCADGRIRLSAQQDGGFYSLTWKESGGPPIAAPAAEAGFGSRLIALTVEERMRGRLERHWEPDGLRVRISLPAAALTRALS